MVTVSWCVAVFALLAAMLLYSCARAEETLAWAVRIMEETHKRVITNHQSWYARDFRYIPAGQEVWGNCSTFSTTAAVLATMAGHPGKVVQCEPRHVVAVADGWVFDSSTEALEQNMRCD